MIIRVTVGNNMKRNNINIDDSRTLRSVLEEQEIDYTAGVTSLDGAPLQAGEMDKTFADFNIAEKCSLITVVKADNAVSVAG